MKLLSIKTVQIKQATRTSVDIIKLIWSIDKWLLLGAYIATTIPAIVPFINIYIYKLVIDLVVKIVAGGEFNAAQFYPLIGFRLLTFFIQDASFRTQDFMSRLLWTKVPIKLNQLILGKISSLDIHYFENDKFRDLLEKVRESREYRPQQLLDSLLYTNQSLIQFLIALIALARLNWFFIILIGVVSVPEFINQTFQSKLSWGIWGQHTPSRKRYGYLSYLLQHHREVKEIKIFSLAEKFLQEIRSIQEKFYLDNKKISQRAYGTNLIFNLLSTAIFVGIEIYVILEAIAKKVTVGDINFYTGVVSNFQNGLGGFLQNMNRVFENSLYVESIFELQRLKPIIKTAENPIRVSIKKTPKIEFKNVNFTYPETDKIVLKDFTLAINPGEKIAFVGENGAGKSTIIKLLLRFYDVESGEILIDGVNVKQLNLESWYGCIGVLFQDFNRYEDTLKNNIAYGKIKSDGTLKGVIEASISSGANKVSKDFKKGYDQMLGKLFEGGIELSGGQWQKVALARAFYRNAPILVLDEPTASIDARAEAEIFDKVEKLSKDKTVVIISHRFSTVRNADKIYVIESGRIVETGTHEQLIKENGQYAALFKLQAKGYQ